MLARGARMCTIRHVVQRTPTHPRRPPSSPSATIAPLYASGHRADRLGARREARGGPRRARLVARRARPPRRRLDRLGAQDREERHDADDRHAHEGRGRARHERELLHRRGRRGARGDRRPRRRARAAVHVEDRDRARQRLRALRPLPPGRRRGASSSRTPTAGPSRCATRARSSSTCSRARCASRSTASRSTSSAGDSIHFRTDRPHTWENPTEHPARALWFMVRGVD